MRSWRIKNCGAVSETMDNGSVDKTMEDQVDLNCGAVDDNMEDQVNLNCRVVNKTMNHGAVDIDRIASCS